MSFLQLQGARILVNKTLENHKAHKLVRATLNELFQSSFLDFLVEKHCFFFEKVIMMCSRKKQRMIERLNVLHSMVYDFCCFYQTCVLLSVIAAEETLCCN